MSAPTKFEKAYIRRIQFSSLFKMCFLGGLVLIGPFMLLCGIAALFGAHTIEFNGRYVTGMFGFIQSLIMILVSSAGLALCFGSICYFGIRVAGRFFSLELGFIRSENRPNHALQTMRFAVTSAAAPANRMSDLKRSAFLREVRTTASESPGEKTARGPKRKKLSCAARK